MLGWTLLAACALAPRDPLALPPSPRDAYVLVWDDAWLYTDRMETSQRARSATDSGRGPGQIGRVHAFKLLDVEGEWVRVETSPEASDRRHCAATVPGLSSYRIRFFVGKHDLATVTRRETLTEYEDGTAIWLAAGVPVGSPRKEDRGRAIYTVQTDAFRLATGLDVDAVGLAYSPSRLFSTESTARVVASGAPMSFGSGARLEPTGSLPLFVHEERPVEQASLVTLHSRCGVYTVAVHSADVRARDSATLVGISLSSRTPGLYARAAATAYWPNGAPAGVTAREDALAQEAAPSGPRRCFLKSIAAAPDAIDPASESTLSLCFDPADLWATPPPR